MGALEISLQIYEPNDVNLAILFADIGMVCYKQGKLDEGLENCDKAMMIFTEKCGIDSPEVGKTHNSMAIILAEQGKNDLALIHFNKALDITIKNNPKGHIDIAILYDNIGQINYDRSKYKEALDCFKKALEIKITL
jgi:tetratricopeptide (TPR) repeat protein